MLQIWLQNQGAVHQDVAEQDTPADADNPRRLGSMLCHKSKDTDCPDGLRALLDGT